MKTWIKLISKNKIYNRLQSNLYRVSARKRKVKLLNETFIQYPNVFPIDKFNDTEIFTKAINVKPDEDFLEIGTGAGATAIILAKAGANVVGVDINQFAIENAKENASLHKIENNINFLISDVFSNVPNKLFDTIYFNVPFCCTGIRELTELQKSVFDFQYSTMKNFIKNSKKFLKPQGRLLIGFSNTWGLPDLLLRFLYDAGYKNITMLTQQIVEWNSIEYDLTLYEIINTVK